MDEVSNRVGSNVPADTKLAELMKQLGEVVSEFKKFTITLSPEERQRLLKPRKGADEHIKRIYEVAKKYSLTLPHAPLDNMMSDVKLEQALAPFEDLFSLGLQMMSDTGMQASTESWQAFLSYYSVLSSMAERNPTIAHEISSTVEFMRVYRTKKAAPAPHK